LTLKTTSQPNFQSPETLISIQKFIRQITLFMELLQAPNAEEEIHRILYGDGGNDYPFLSDGYIRPHLINMLWSACLNHEKPRLRFGLGTLNGKMFKRSLHVGFNFPYTQKPDLTLGPLPYLLQENLQSSARTDLPQGSVMLSLDFNLLRQAHTILAQQNPALAQTLVAKLQAAANDQKLELINAKSETFGVWKRSIPQLLQEVMDVAKFKDLKIKLGEMGKNENDLCLCQPVILLQASEFTGLFDFLD
jgi:hypothetical protein